MSDLSPLLPKAPEPKQDDLLTASAKQLHRLYGALRATGIDTVGDQDVCPKVLEALCDDLNTPGAFTAVHELASRAYKGDLDAARQLIASMRLMGFMLEDPVDVDGYLHGKHVLSEGIRRMVSDAVGTWSYLRDKKLFDSADAVRESLRAKFGVVAEATKNGPVWSFCPWAADPEEEPEKEDEEHGFKPR